MKRFIFILASLILATFTLLAQRSVQDRIFKDAYRHNLMLMVEIFDHEVPGQCYAEWYAYEDIDGDMTCEVLLADRSRERIMAFKYEGDGVRQVPVGSAQGVDWNFLFWFVKEMYDETMVDESDITLRYRPIFADDLNISTNRFKATSEVWSYVDPNKVNTYNRMIFKPHVGEVKLVGNKATGKEVVYTWALKDPSFTKKMFRGYADTQASPIIVPQAFLESHNPLQFSRWLNGEPIQYASLDEKRIISSFYGGRHIVEARRLANCDLNERTFYQVVFAPQNGEVLSSFVCIAEGEVVSVKNDWEKMDGNSHTMLENGEDLSDIFFHQPQIMAMMATEAGLELYVRWNSMEGIHYSIWREYWDQWVTIQDDYEYLVGD